MTASVIDRLTALRHALSQNTLAAWIAPTGDPHLSEYLPDDWAFRRYLSGFTGSAGTLVVTASSAALWTDSRYWEQAARELAGSGIVLMKEGLPETLSIEAWLVKMLPTGAVVGLDARTMNAQRFTALERALAVKGLSLANDAALMASVWTERPSASDAPVFAFTRAQTSVTDKLAAVRDALQDKGADALFVSTLDDIAWLTNLRGGDIACNPVFTAHCLIEADRATLFVDRAKLSDALVGALAEQGIRCALYDEALEALLACARTARVWIDTKHTSAHFVEAVKSVSAQPVIEALQPSTLLKSRKSTLELDALRETMAIDGVALCELFAWLDEQLRNDVTLTEWDVSEKLFALRSAYPDFLDNSFTTISAFGANAAEPHYAPSRELAATLARDNVLLLDSGGQYLGGTTDITRTVLLGEAESSLKRDFTAVLRGHIALACARFPAGVYASQLDTIARAPLWDIGADYGHGTGHGVGFGLSVHEGPVHISPRAMAVESARVVLGLVLSNEPGLYRPGRWGVRTENLVTPVPDTEPADTPFLRFETLSLCPIDARLIQTNMLSPTDLWWLNTYHRRVRETLKPRLSAAARAWLERATDIV